MFVEGGLRAVRDLSRFRVGEVRRLEAREWRDAAVDCRCYFGEVERVLWRRRKEKGTVHLVDFLSLAVLAMVVGSYGGR